jgi:putative cell wall-binding protein
MAPARPAEAAGSTFGFTRVAGADRFATAALLSMQAFPTGAGTALVADGFDPTDAVSADYLAGQLHAPILLVNRSGPVPAATLDALRTLKTAQLILVGLSGAIGDDVQAQFELTPSTAPGGGDLVVSRIGGATRYDTMNLLDEDPGPSATIGTVDGAKTAIIASGAGFADALAVGPLAYARSLPIVLTDPDTLSPQAAQTLEDLGIQQVIIAGGTNAVSVAVEDAIHGLGVATLARLGGVDRSDTARLVGDYAIAHFGFSDSQFDLASGGDAGAGADALALGPLAAQQGVRTIQLLTSDASPGPGALQFVRDQLPTLQENLDNTLAGGEESAPDTVVSPIITAFQTGGGATALPELVGAEVLATVGAHESGSQFAPGTLIRFIFDKALTGTPDYTRFLAYDSSDPGTPYQAAGGPGDPDSMLDPVDPDAVLANFPSLTSAASLVDVTLVAVEAGAVSGEDGGANPDGAAAVGAAHVSSAAPETTEAPNARLIEGLRPASAASATAIDVVFDKPAFAQPLRSDVPAADIVFTDESNRTDVEAACQIPAPGDAIAGGGGVPGGDGTAQWTIVCPDDPSSPATPLSASRIARIVFQPGMLGTAPANRTGDVAAQYIGATTGQRHVSLTPDLAGAALVPAAVFGGPDSIAVTFDQPVTAPAVTRFSAVMSNGEAIPSLSAISMPGNSRAVLIALPVGTDANGVAVSVGAGAVTNLTGVPNADDEIGTVNTPSAKITPGLTAGPGLISAALRSLIGASGTPVAEAAFLTFSEALGGPPAPPLGRLHAYDADGTELTCAPAPGGGTNGLDKADSLFPSVADPATLECDNWSLGGLADGSPAPLADQQAIVLVTADPGLVANEESQVNPVLSAFATGGDAPPRMIRTDST